MTKFAEGTSVPVEKSRAEIERMITRYGATSTVFMTAPGRAMIMFDCNSRRVRFELTLPVQDDKRYEKDGRGSFRTPQKRQEVWEQACRRQWRAMALVIKAKMEAVESGITTFEDEFLAHIVMPDGKRVSDHVKPTIARVYDSGQMLPLLPPPGVSP